jgi:glycine cleavage system H protein
MEEGHAVLGITEFAQSELGDVVFVELPEPGDVFDADDEIGTIESVKAVAEIYTPVSGEVVEVNTEIQDRPEIVNQDPHERGWLVRLKLSKPDETSSLMSARDYQQFVAGSK